MWGRAERAAEYCCTSKFGWLTRRKRKTLGNIELAKYIQNET